MEGLTTGLAYGLNMAALVTADSHRIFVMSVNKGCVAPAPNLCIQL